MKTPASKLVHILIGKAVIETLLVGAIAVGFNVTAFPPTFHGWSEALPASKSLAGWTVNDASPWERLDVQLFVDGQFQANQTANLSRPDVSNSGWAKDEWHGYSFQLPKLDPGTHQLRVYAVHQSGGGKRYTLQLIGDPVTINVRGDGSWENQK
ncbi:MAG TPA: hypothetical protein VI306_20280 [Pyrinomonadaceae bacterium]